MEWKYVLPGFTTMLEKTGMKSPAMNYMADGKKIRDRESWRKGFELLPELLTSFVTGSEANAKKQGMLRSEGKEYVVQEGDVIIFRFNV